MQNSMLNLCTQKNVYLIVRKEASGKQPLTIIFFFWKQRIKLSFGNNFFKK